MSPLTRLQWVLTQLPFPPFTDEEAEENNSDLSTSTESKSPRGHLGFGEVAVFLGCINDIPQMHG